ncbi:hypothetical protein C0989_004688 [Termitomyces sp. Mn162]|nr:hypothetical protein C0989_004688 [Termitomyces sp. Mn162]
MVTLQRVPIPPTEDQPLEFRKKDGSLSKMRNHRGNIPILPQTKLCPHCPAKFTRTTHLNRHLRTHPVEPDESHAPRVWNPRSNATDNTLALSVLLEEKNVYSMGLDDGPRLQTIPPFGRNEYRQRHTAIRPLSQLLRLQQCLL